MRYLFCSLGVALALSGGVAHAAVYTPQGDMLGAVTYHMVVQDDNLYQIARDTDLGIDELMAANPGVDKWIPKPRTHLMLPTAHILPPGPREGIVLNLAELRMFYYPGDGSVMTFPITVGREGWATPTGVTTIWAKREHPIWYVPEDIRREDPSLPAVVPAGPENPFGDYALNLGWSGYRIHGTNRPASIGTRASHGCIRLYPEDIKMLFHAVQVGTKVTVVDAPYKLGWRNGELYLQVTSMQARADAGLVPQNPITVSEAIARAVAAGGESITVNWEEVQDAVARHDGRPVVIASSRRRSLLPW